MSIVITPKVATYISKVDALWKDFKQRINIFCMKIDRPPPFKADYNYILNRFTLFKNGLQGSIVKSDANNNLDSPNIKMPPTGSIFMMCSKSGPPIHRNFAFGWSSSILLEHLNHVFLSPGSSRAPLMFSRIVLESGPLAGD